MQKDAKVGLTAIITFNILLQAEYFVAKSRNLYLFIEVQVEK